MPECRPFSKTINDGRLAKDSNNHQCLGLGSETTFKSTELLDGLVCLEYISTTNKYKV